MGELGTLALLPLMQTALQTVVLGKLKTLGLSVLVLALALRRAAAPWTLVALSLALLLPALSLPIQTRLQALLL